MVNKKRIVNIYYCGDTMNYKPTKTTTQILTSVINNPPCSYAFIKGDNHIEGTVCFYPFLLGSIMLYEIKNLPDDKKGIFAFHIHSGKNCQDVQTHYNPTNKLHPYHIGDLPPIFSSCSLGWSMVYLDKIDCREIVGKTIVIHGDKDDFTTQPSGNPGRMIACGVIEKFHN